MDEEDELALLHRSLHELLLEHRDLDDVIARLALVPTQDVLQLQRLKKRKLQIRDQIERLRSRLIPDLPA